MDTYLLNGTKCDINYILDPPAFGIQVFEGDRKQYYYPNDSIRAEINDSLLNLYDVFRDLLFDNTDEYYKELDSLPFTIITAGLDSATDIKAEDFSEFLQKEKISKTPHLYKHIYLADCQFLISTIQNLLDGMEHAFINYYVSLCDIGNEFDIPKNDQTLTITSQQCRWLSSLLESYFTKAYSILDLFCKITYELLAEHNEIHTNTKLKCANKLWGDRNRLAIENTNGTIFENSELITVIESLRNEVIHNGTWELNPKVYLVYENEEIVERFMLFPDISQGRLSTVKNRKHFYGTNNKVNNMLQNIHIEFLNRVLKTSELLCNLNQKTLD